MVGILSDLKVLELTNAPSGSYCAKLLAEQGANTIKVEHPGWGDATRHEPPFINGEPDFDGSTTFLAFNTNKRGITLDLEQLSGRDLLLRLTESADVVIESYPPDHLNELGLGYERLHAVTGSADPPPMGTALQQMEITAARNGVIAIMAALLYREQAGQGQHIDISVQEAAVSTPSGLIHPYSFTGRSPHRGGSDGNVMDGMHLPTLDGEVTLTTAGTGGRPMQVWAEFLEEPDLLDSKFSTRRGRLENWEELYALVAPRLAQWNNLDLMRETMSRGLVVGLVQSPKQVVESPHLAERGYFVELDHPVAGNLKYAGAGFLMDGVNSMEARRPAPRLGEHNTEVFCQELGISRDDLYRLRVARII